MAHLSMNMLRTVHHEGEATHQSAESGRKDIESSFSVLQRKWHIITLPACFWSVDTMARMMRCAIILNNIIVKERGDYDELDEEDKAFLNRTDVIR